MIYPPFTAGMVSDDSSIAGREKRLRFDRHPCGSRSLGRSIQTAGLKYSSALVLAGVVGGSRKMVFVTTQPDVLAGAAASLSGIGDSMVARNAAASAPTTALAPAASDLVSAATALQFGQHGALYQQIATHAAEVHEQLVAALRSGAGAYAAAEAANVASAGLG
jgi:PE family